MPPSVKPIEPQKLLEKTRKFLQTYRLSVELGAIENYTRALAGLSEEEVTVAMDRANRENATNFAPGPGVIYDIAMEIRDGSTGGYLQEMQSWPDSGPHPDWAEEEGWKALKDRIGMRKLAPAVMGRVVPKVRDLQDPAYLQRLCELNQQLNAHYAAQSVDPTLPRSEFEKRAVEQATGKRIRKPKREQ